MTSLELKSAQFIKCEKGHSQTEWTSGLLSWLVDFPQVLEWMMHWRTYQILDLFIDSVNIFIMISNTLTENYNKYFYHKE